MFSDDGRRRQIEDDEPPVRRGAQLYFMASVMAQVSALLRYVLLARLLGPEQLGLAATLVVTSAFFDLISDTGADRFLIQDRHGDTLPVQKLVQLVYVGRGIMIAAGLVIFAIPIASFYQAPKLAVGLVFLSLSPFILGFLHLDLRRDQRRLDFRSEAFGVIASESAALVATAVAAWLTRDFTAILYGLITRALIMVLVSHLRAQRPYALGFDRQHGPRLTRFAAPLMLTGVMLFIGSQGDRVLVARLLGFKELGHYSTVLLLIYYPANVLLRYIHALYVPMVAAGRDDCRERERVSDTLGGQTMLLAMTMATGFAIVAPPMVTILYGARYAQAPMIVGLIGILQTTRFIMNWPTTIALSTGRSRTVLTGNLMRLLAFPAAYLGVITMGGLLGLVAGFIVGEMIAIGTALVLLNRNTGHALLTGFDRLGAFLLVAIMIALGNWALEQKSLLGGCAAFCGGICLIFWVLRREATTLDQTATFARRLLNPLLFRLARS